jgi:hypothetical protein
MFGAGKDPKIGKGEKIFLAANRAASHAGQNPKKFNGSDATEILPKFIFSNINKLQHIKSALSASPEA